MGSGRHYSRRDRSPSPYSDSSDSSSGRSTERRSHRSHRSQKPKSSPRDAPPSYSSSSKRPDIRESRRPELSRSMSEDTYRHTTGNKHSSRSNTTRDRGVDRERRSRRHRSDDDDDYYYYDKHGKAHTRNLSDRSRSSSSSRSRDRRGGDRHDKPVSKMDTFKPIVEDVLAAFGVVQAKHAKDEHRGGHSSRGYGHDDRDYRSSRSSRSRSHGGRGRSNDRNAHSGHHEYSETMMDPDKMPNKQTAALRAAITAAAVEAFRTRKEGGITPERLMKIAGAAIAAGGLDAIVQRDKRSGHEGGNTRELIESVIGGMKSSSAFGHRIRRHHGLGTGEQMKHRLMQAATAKMMDRPFGNKDHRDLHADKRSRSSTGLTSLMRSMTVK